MVDKNERFAKIQIDWDATLEDKTVIRVTDYLFFGEKAGMDFVEFNKASILSLKTAKQFVARVKGEKYLKPRNMIHTVIEVVPDDPSAIWEMTSIERKIKFKPLGKLAKIIDRLRI